MCIPGFSVDGGHTDGSLCTYLGFLLMEKREMVLSTYLDSLLVEDREMVLLCTYMDSLLMEERDNFLSVQTWTLCWGRTGRWSFFCSLYVPRLSASGQQGNTSLCTFLAGLSFGGDQEDASFCTHLNIMLMEDREMFLSVQTWAQCLVRTGICSFFLCT